MSEVPQAGRIPRFTIGDRLRKAREMTGLDQTEFGREIGDVSRGTVSNYESAAVMKRKPIILRAWALRTGVPLAWIETGHEGGPRPGVEEDAEERPDDAPPAGLEPATDGLRVIAGHRVRRATILPFSPRPRRVIPATPARRSSPLRRIS